MIKSRRLEQVVSAINELAIDDPGFFGERVFFWRILVGNMQHGVAFAYEKVRDQHAVAAKVEQLGAHDSSMAFLRAFHQALNGGVKFIGEHVVSIIAERWVAHCDVWRLVGRHLFTPASAQIFFPDIICANFREPQLQVFTIEMRMAARHGKGTDIFQQADVVRLQHAGKAGKIARGMSDGEDGGHRVILFHRTRSLSIDAVHPKPQGLKPIHSQTS